MVEIFGIRFVKTEVEYANGIYSLQSIVPIASPLCLFTDRESGIEDASVLEELLLGLLHLDKEFFAFLVFTIYIEHGLAVEFCSSQMFAVQVG